MQINLVTLGISNLKNATEFYAKWFNKKPATASNDHVTFFNLNGAKLSLYPIEALAKDANINDQGNGFRKITLAINADSKDEVDLIFSQGITCGAKSIKKPEMVFWGGYSGYLSDLDGHLWEIAWNPHFQKNENGEISIP